MLSTVIITQKPESYPNYYTYTAYEFLVLRDETLRGIEMVLIDERIKPKKLRKIRNRMAAFNIVEIDILPEDVVDVAEARVVHLPHSGIYVDIKENASPEEMRKTILGHLREMTDKMLQDNADDKYHVKLPSSGKFVNLKALTPESLMRLGVESVDELLAKIGSGAGFRFANSMRETVDHTRDIRELELKLLDTLKGTGPSARLPLDRLLSDFNRLSEEDFAKRLRDGTLLGSEVSKQLRDSAMELKRELLAKKPGMYRSKGVPAGMVVHKQGFTAGKERRVKVKPWLENPQIVQMFKSKQELADHLVSKLPKGTELRKRNALKFKICVEMSEDAVLSLAADTKAQVTLVNKYC